MHPSLTALRAFSLVAEKGSLRRAAETMNVTQPAVSQQLRTLEGHLGRKLLKRHGRGVLLTDDGQVLAQYLARGFDEIARGVLAVTERPDDRVVRVTTSPSFAAFWLVPKITAFQAEHPDIRIQLDLSAEAKQVDGGNFDLAIRYCRAEELPPSADPMLYVRLNVICRPILLQNQEVTADLLRDLPWLQEFGVSVVPDWFARQGLSGHGPKQVSEMPGNLIIDAVKRGEAVAYTVCDWVGEELQRGDLIELWDPPERGVYFPVVNRPTPACDAFVAWLKTQALGAPV